METTGSHWLFFVFIFGTIRWNNTAQSVSNGLAQEPRLVLGMKFWKSIGNGFQDALIFSMYLELNEEGIKQKAAVKKLRSADSFRLLNSKFFIIAIPIFLMNCLERSSDFVLFLNWGKICQNPLDYSVKKCLSAYANEFSCIHKCTHIYKYINEHLQEV